MDMKFTQRSKSKFRHIKFSFVSEISGGGHKI